MEETKKCPYCGEDILAVAKKCKHCGEWLDEEEKAKHEGMMQTVPEENKSKKGLIIGAFVAVILVICCVTCPNKEKHVDAINEQMTKIVSEAVDSVAGNTGDNNFFAEGMKMLGKSIASNFINSLVGSNVNVDNYGLFSIAKADDKVLSIGVLGHVFTTFTAKDIKEHIGDYLNDKGSDSKKDPVSSAIDNAIDDVVDEDIIDTIANSLPF